MRLDQIILHNFRQYLGTQKINFSKDKDRNITVLHGETGSGKTALLNAFSWCLFGKTDLPNSNDIINERAQLNIHGNDEVEAYVEMQFDNDGRRYSVVRSIKARKNTEGELVYSKSNLKVDVDDLSILPKDAQTTIDQIIPSDMKSYFFFDGERIDKMQDKEQAKDIKKAIKIVMGLEILDRSVKHMEGVKKIFREESAKFGTSEQQNIDAKLNDNSESTRKKSEEIELQETNKAAVEKEIKEVQTRLRILEETKELQQQKDMLIKDKNNVEIQKKELHKQIRHFISKTGYLAFAGQAIEYAKTFLDDKREQNQIPTGIKQQFVDDLIQNEECICGRPINKGTEEYSKMMEWRGRSSTKELEDAFINSTGDLKFAIKERTRMFDDLQNYKKKKDELEQVRGVINADLREIEKKFEGKDTEEIASLVKKERDQRAQLEEIKDLIKRLEIEMQNLKKAYEQLEKEFNTIKLDNEKAILAKKRMNLCDKLKGTFFEIYKLRSEEIQIRLQEKISDVYSRLLRKGFQIILTENYEIKVYKVIGSERRSVGLSQGERQITSLSFIGALVDTAREQLEKEKNNDSVSSMRFGGYYPIVMDSPFGQLDDDHRARVAKGLPTLAHQVVVIVSSSQWKGEVYEHMKDRVGKEYELQFYGGTQDYTEIKEVI